MELYSPDAETLHLYTGDSIALMLKPCTFTQGAL